MGSPCSCGASEHVSQSVLSELHSGIDQSSIDMGFDSPKHLGFFTKILERCIVGIVLLFQFCIPGAILSIVPAMVQSRWVRFLRSPFS